MERYRIETRGQRKLNTKPVNISSGLTKSNNSPYKHIEVNMSQLLNSQQIHTSDNNTAQSQICSSENVENATKDNTQSIQSDQMIQQDNNEKSDSNKNSVMLQEMKKEIMHEIQQAISQLKMKVADDRVFEEKKTENNGLSDVMLQEESLLERRQMIKEQDRIKYYEDGTGYDRRNRALTEELQERQNEERKSEEDLILEYLLQEQNNKKRREDKEKHDRKISEEDNEFHDRRNRINDDELRRQMTVHTGEALVQNNGWSKTIEKVIDEDKISSYEVGDIDKRNRIYEKEYWRQIYKPTKETLLQKTYWPEKRDNIEKQAKVKFYDPEEKKERRNIVYSDKDRRQRQRYGVKLPEYTGKESWKVWRNRFEEVAYINNWTEEERLCELLPKLTDEAGDFVFSQLSKETRRNYSQLMDELSSRFRIIETKQSFGIKFSRRDQHDFERVEEYAAELKRLYDKSYPLRQREVRQEDLIRRFFDGLKDDEASFQVEYLKNPENIDEAVVEVINFQEKKKYIKLKKRRNSIKYSDYESSDEDDEFLTKKAARAAREKKKENIKLASVSKNNGEDINQEKQSGRN